ncbi:MAG: hypothetical protein Ct9H90mP7_1450 [Candidatus Neomarinimicrobiota bacterium]|nr:MAG: hypothetical protein Ct9H90mP7_1450 [Candidatus Neomarinimicrobiota bacterium]
MAVCPKPQSWITFHPLAKKIKFQKINHLAQKKDLIAASILEVGMKKRFHFKDGSISEGEIIAVNDDRVTFLPSQENLEFQRLNS